MNDVVIIHPKSKQQFSQSMQMLKSQISPEEIEVDVQRVRPTKNGGILIGCSNKEDATKLQTEIASKLNNIFTVRKSGLRNPRIKMLDLENPISETI